jgi:hypothetical protein
MKKLIFLIFIAQLSMSTNACTILFESSSDDVVKVMSKSNGWELHNYFSICNKLNSENASLLITGDATVLMDRSVAWASVAVKDKSLNVYSNEWNGTSTKVSDFASVDTANAMLFDAIHEAVEKLVLEKALRSLNAARKKIGMGS